MGRERDGVGWSLKNIEIKKKIFGMEAEALSRLKGMINRKGRVGVQRSTDQNRVKGSIAVGIKDTGRRNSLNEDTLKKTERKELRKGADEIKFASLI